MKSLYISTECIIVSFGDSINVLNTIATFGTLEPIAWYVELWGKGVEDSDGSLNWMNKEEWRLSVLHLIEWYYCWPIWINQEAIQIHSAFGFLG